MPQPDVQMSDIVVIIDDAMNDEIDKVVELLKADGGSIDQVNHDEGVIEATVLYSKISRIRAIPSVKYVRSVFVYEAEFSAPDEQIPR
jgi:hypothetical protein